MKNAVIVVAGGSGTRMGGDLPKQYQELEGQTYILHIGRRFIELLTRVCSDFRGMG